MNKAKDVLREEVYHFAMIMEARLQELNELYICFSHAGFATMIADNLCESRTWRAGSRSRILGGIK
jgi:hypothetical protein